MEGMSNHVIICGFGRVGELIGQVRRAECGGAGARDSRPIRWPEHGGATGTPVASSARSLPAPATHRPPARAPPPASSCPSQMLSERLIPFVALDCSASRVQDGKRLDLPVYFGDAGSPAVLHAVGAERAACAVSSYRC